MFEVNYMLERISCDILAALKQNVPYAITTGVIVMTAVCIIMMCNTNDKPVLVLKNNKKRLLMIYMIYIYCFIVVSITFLSREPGSRDAVDLRLFSTFSHSLAGNIYPIENIILFLPFGFLLPMLWKKLSGIIYSIIAGIIFSLTIEVSQFITKRGYFQIDDIVTNTLGCVLGAGIFLIYHIVRKRIIRTRK